MDKPAQALSVLMASTLAFAACFMSWTLFGVVGIPIRAELGLTAAQSGLLMAIPLLSGALAQLPLGLWADRRGGRTVMGTALMLSVPALWFAGIARSFGSLLIAGLLLGLCGGAFAVGMAYVARWYPHSRRGLAMGVFGAGIAGAAFNGLVAPGLIFAFGWPSVPRVYAAVLLIASAAFWLLSHEDPRHRLPLNTRMGEQLRALRDRQVLRLSQCYTVFLGGFVALVLWLPQHYRMAFGLDIRAASLLTAGFMLSGGLLHALGGWLADRYGAQAVTRWALGVGAACLLVLSCAPTPLTGTNPASPGSLGIGPNLPRFTALLFALAAALACGMAGIFKAIGDAHATHLGTVGGAVGMAGGLAGFALAVAFGLLVDQTGLPASAFLLLFALVALALWMTRSPARRPLSVRRSG